VKALAIKKMAMLGNRLIRLALCYTGRQLGDGENVSMAA